MIPEGHVHIELSRRPGHAAKVSYDQPGVIGHLLCGKSPSDATQIIPRLYSVCGTAQAYAAVTALERALGVEADAQTAGARAALTAMETLREHVLRIAFDWPGFTDRVRHAFPAGQFEFLIGEEEGVGRYQMCSLFPSMFVFENEEAAVAAAEAALVALFEAETNEAGEEERFEQAISSGKPLSTETVEVRSARSQRTTPKAISRRALFTGFRPDKTTG
jgi:[NiFe] hydrogenase assembly HybE family chaperone